MAKKSFIGGIDNLLASAGLKKKAETKAEPAVEKKEAADIPEDEKHWLLIKIQSLNEELKLWRTGKITMDQFHKSLKKHGLKYDEESNEFKEI